MVAWAVYILRPCDCYMHCIDSSNGSFGRAVGVFNPFESMLGVKLIYGKGDGFKSIRF